MQRQVERRGSVMNDQARGQLEKESRRGLGICSTHRRCANRGHGVDQPAQGEFQEKLNPIIEQVRVVRALLLIFSIRDSGVVSAEPVLISRTKSSSASMPPPRPRRKSIHCVDKHPGSLDRLCYRYRPPSLTRCTEHEPGRRVVAYKNVTVSEGFFSGDFPARR